MQETGVQSLGQEDALKKGIASHSSILACRILWTENPDGLQSMGLQRVRHDWAINTHSLFITSATREAWQPRDHQSNVASPGFPNSSSHCALLWSGEPRLSLPTRLMTGKRAGNDLSIFVSLQAWAPPPILEDYICLAVQRTLKSLLQHHSSKASILQHSAFFMVQFSHLYMTTGDTITVIWTYGPLLAKWCLCFLICYLGLL